MASLASIIITTYYRDERLEQAIESATEQTYEPVEVIVVDDSGERYAESIAKGYDVEYLAHDQNRGAQIARNTGIEASSGEYVQLLDDDDQLHPTKIEKHVQIMESGTDISTVYCGYEIEGEVVAPAPDFRGNVLQQTLRFEYGTCVPSTMLLDRDSLEAIMPLSPRDYFDGGGMRIELALQGNFEYSDEVLVTRSDLPNSRGDKAKDRLISERVDLFHEYSDLYERHDSMWRYEKLRDHYVSYCYKLLQQEVWSFSAILAGMKATYYMGKTKEFQITTVGLLAASFFGSFGLSVGRLFKRLVDNGSHN